jgi:hypothetical protein
VINTDNPVAWRIREILFPRQNVVGVADFMHANPSMPNREITGLIRLQKINEGLGEVNKNEPLTLKIATIMYDQTLPRSESANEGGGCGIYTGLQKNTEHIISNPEAVYWRQPAKPVCIEKYIDKAINRVCRWYEGIKQEELRAYLQNKITPVLSLLNSKIVSTNNAGDAIHLFKKSMYAILLSDLSIEWSLLSSFYSRIALALDELFSLGIDWRTIPISNPQMQLFTLINENGQHLGYISLDGTYLSIVYRNGRRQRIEWNLIAEGLQNRNIIPSWEIYFIVYVIAPAWLHFGNLYNKHYQLMEWWKTKATILKNFRIGQDGDNSIPLGKVQTRGKHSRSLITVDWMLRSRNEITHAAQCTARQGRPYWDDIKFKDRLHISMIENDRTQLRKL